MTDMKDKVTLITGSSSGIGQGSAQGAREMILYRANRYRRAYADFFD
jgi:NADP-dependent 3-hydroxy acid dehydrogenase YdfG